MTTEKRQVLIIGIIGCLIAAFFSILGIRLFYLAENGQTYGIGFFSLSLEGKTLAAVTTWIGFVLLFFNIRKIGKYLSNKTSS
jgi:hypothetical protein